MTFRTLSIIAALLAAATLSAHAQDQMSGYGAMRIDRVGYFEGNFDGRIEKMSQGVQITLLADGADKADLPIQADTMDFTWEGDSPQPVRIVMTGNVQIKHPSANVRAGRADWDFKTGDVIFTGSPVMDSPKFQNMRADKMILNMEAGTFRAEGMKIDRLETESMGGPAADSSTLTEADISDWTGLVDTLKAAGASDTPSPAKQVVGQLDPGAREQLMGTDTNVIVQNKGALLKGINRILDQPGLYDATAFVGVSLPETLAQQVAAPPASGAELKAMNRGLLNAAFPGNIAAVK